MIRNVYAVYDTKAEDIHGGLLLLNHDAVAIRVFTDAYQAEGTVIHTHPHDFKLVCLGYLKDRELVSELRVIITGEQLVATQEQR